MVALGGNLVKIIISATDQASAIVDGVKGKLGGLSSAMDKLRGPMLAVGAASTGAAVVAVKSFSDFESAIAGVTTLMDDGEDAMDTYGETVKRISTELPVMGGHLAVTEGLYQTLSAGITDTADATLFLETATKAAIGGSAELETVILAGTKAMASFGLEVDDTERIMDVFAATVKAGQTTMPELAAAFPKVAGVAGEMGLTLEETAGILAGLTKILPNTDVAATSLNAVLTGLLKPTDAMKETLEGMGFESGQAAIESLGLMGTLQELKGVVGDDAEAMGELFGNVRAIKAVFPALGGAADDIAESLKIVGDSSGLMQQQFEIMEQTTGARMTKLQNKFGDLAIRLGESLLPILEKLTPVVEMLLEAFAGLDPVIQAAIVVGGMLAGAFALLWPVISGVAGAIGGAGGLSAVLATLTGPVGWVITAVALLAAAWATDFAGIQGIVGSVIETVTPLLQKAIDLLMRIAGILIDVLGPAFDLIFPIIESVIETYLSTVLASFQQTIGILELVIETLDALLSAFEGDFEPLKDVVKKTLDGINLFISNFVDGMFDFGKSLIQSFVDGLLAMGNIIADTFWSLVPKEAKQFIAGAVGAVKATAGFVSDVGAGIASATGFDDFIARPGMGIASFSPDDTIIGVKDISALSGVGGGGGTPALQLSVIIQNATFSNGYDANKLGRDLAESAEDAWANKQNK